VHCGGLPGFFDAVDGALNLARGYISSMDQFDRQRVSELRREIASLQRDSESYRLQEHH
jgi:hypothetical protein